MPECPKCGNNCRADFQECPSCGIVFKKWAKHVKQKRDLGLKPSEIMVSDTSSPSFYQKNRQKLVAAGVGFVLFFFLWNVSRRSALKGPEDIGFPIFENGKWGFINAQGKVAISPRFDAAEMFSQGRAAVMVNSVWGFVDHRGQWKVEPKYGRVGRYNEGFTLARLSSGYWQILDLEGRVVGATPFDPIGPGGGLDIATFHNGRAIVENIDRKKLFINTSGTGVGGVFDEAKDFSEGLAAVRSVGLTSWQFIRPDGTLAISNSFSKCEPFSEGSAAVKKFLGESSSGMGFINPRGEYLLWPRYMQARPFCDGLAWVQVDNNLCGAIDRVGRVVIQTSCQEKTGDFSNGYAWIQKLPDNLYGVLDKDGTLVLRAAFQTSPIFSGGANPLAFVVASEEKKKFAGYVDKWGRWVWKISLFKVSAWAGASLENDRALKSCHMGEVMAKAMSQK